MKKPPVLNMIREEKKKDKGEKRRMEKEAAVVGSCRKSSFRRGGVSLPRPAGLDLAL